jgi:hypothetical protein
MVQYQVARLHDQGQDIYAIIVEPRYGGLTCEDKNQIRKSIKLCARSAGLDGVIVTVWNAGGGRMGFLAPEQLTTFFHNITIADVMAKVSLTLTCQ